MNIKARPLFVKWGVVLLCFGAYLTAGYFLQSRFGTAVAVLSALPVAVAGLVFGFYGGIAAAAATVLLNRLAFYSFDGTSFFSFTGAGSIPGALGLALFGATVGTLRGEIKKRRDSERLLRAKEAELNKRLLELDAMARIELALSETERIGLANVLELIAASARELIPSATQAVIHSLDSENNLLIPAAVIGFENIRDGNAKM